MGDAQPAPGTGAANRHGGDRWTITIGRCVAAQWRQDHQLAAPGASTFGLRGRSAHRLTAVTEPAPVLRLAGQLGRRRRPHRPSRRLTPTRRTRPTRSGRRPRTTRPATRWSSTASATSRVGQPGHGLQRTAPATPAVRPGARSTKSPASPPAKARSRSKARQSRPVHPAPVRRPAYCPSCHPDAAARPLGGARSVSSNSI